MKSTKEYLGDSVYVERTQFGEIILTTENGIPSDPSNMIVLDDATLVAFLKFVEKSKNK